MDATIRSKSITISILIHAGIFLLLLLVVMTTPIPPFAEEGGGGGVIVNIGYLESASGAIQPMSENTTIDPAVNKVTPSTQEEENVAVQDFEESPIAKEKKEENKTKVKTEIKTAKVEKKAEPVKTVNPLAIYKGKTTSSSSQGTSTTGAGDQGDRNGDPLSKYYGKNGNGTGGPGTGDGEGPGSGSGKGGGISVSLAGRKMIRTPVIDDRSQETGKVVVAITVDKNGTVIAAVPGSKGSTTTSAYLFSIARDAAMKAKFNSSTDGADIQKGTITFVFVVQ